MREETPEQMFLRGLECLGRHRLTEAANAFRGAFKRDPDNPRFLSYYGLIIALAEGDVQDGLAFCRAAIARAAYEAEYYLNLSRVYTKAGQRKLALRSLLEGLHFDKSSVLLRVEMRRIGIRRRPTFPFLGRDHILNRAVGRLTYQLRSRRQVAGPQETGQLERSG